MLAVAAVGRATAVVGSVQDRQRVLRGAQTQIDQGAVVQIALAQSAGQGQVLVEQAAGGFIGAQVFDQPVRIGAAVLRPPEAALAVSFAQGGELLLLGLGDALELDHVAVAQRLRLGFQCLGGGAQQFLLVGKGADQQCVVHVDYLRLGSLGSRRPAQRPAAIGPNGPAASENTGDGRRETPVRPSWSA